MTQLSAPVRIPVALFREAQERGRDNEAIATLLERATRREATFTDVARLAEEVYYVAGPRMGAGELEHLGWEIKRGVERVADQQGEQALDRWFVEAAR